MFFILTDSSKSIVTDAASGGSEDWAKGKGRVKYSYLFELRPQEQVWDGFLLPENQVTLPKTEDTCYPLNSKDTSKPGNATETEDTCYQSNR